MSYRVDAVVIGAGVVGLAIGRALAREGRDTVVLERADRIGSETSSRNSEVIHAGIYYPPGSLKARLCVRGRDLLYDYLDAHAIPHSRCGKLIVAADKAGRERLEAIARRARECGAGELTWVSGAGIAALEPAVRAELGLLSVASGIVDSHQLMLSLQGELAAAGGHLALCTPAVGGRLGGAGEHVVETGGETPSTLRCRVLVNAAGLHARDTWLSLAGAGHRHLVPPQYYARGHYYSYPAAAFSRLVYPLPEAGGLGIHATIDLAGQVRFGPDVQWIDAVDYRFDDSRRAEFARAIRRWYPALDEQKLQPAYTGIRPKVRCRGELDGDFLIVSEREHGLPGYVSLHGIESPGLTASLAIAEHLLTLL
jgi:L-2-hydroxyglutarate oxidase LhgO